MSKTIKLEDEVYLELDELRVKHETFSQAVERLLQLPRRIAQLGYIIEGGLKYQEFKHKREEDPVRTATPAEAGLGRRSL